jgi:maleylacetate reductase
MKTFVYEGLPARVLFGSGTLAQLGEEVGRLGVKRVVVLATPQQENQARAISDRLGALSAGVFAGATMHTPVERTEDALAFVREAGADGTVALGG